MTGKRISVDAGRSASQVVLEAKIKSAQVVVDAAAQTIAVGSYDPAQVLVEGGAVEAKVVPRLPLKVQVLREATLSSGIGVTLHEKLTGRDVPDQHPIEAITGLRPELDNLAAEVASTFYTHRQEALSNVWRVDHELGRKPSVSVIDGGGAVVYGDIEHVGDDALIIRFRWPITGTAVCN